MRPEFAYRPASAALALGEDGDGPIKADREDILFGRQRHERLTMSDIRTEPADSHRHRLSRLGVAAQLAGQREEAQRRLQVERLGRPALG